ncbi:MAG TPA: penicillin acylase family protein, partial [Ideonella sp.]|nr:penicillin acylase family protein [Ideonella sp.]
MKPCCRPTPPALLFASLLAALLAACAAKGPGPAAVGPPQRSVQIQRTTYGVAHIEAPDFEALAYGVAYAHAEDNVCQTADQLVTVRGERSRFWGAEASGLLGLRSLPNEQIDIYIRGLMDDGELALAESRTSAEAQAMARGYVAGYNRFLKDRAADPLKPLPAPCAGQAWLRPMTPADYRRLNELAATQFGALALADAVVAARLPVPGAAPPKPVALREALQALAGYRLSDAPPGASGWAFGAETSLNGRGLLAGNPYAPWRGADRFWQMHLTIPGQLDVMGAGSGHSPVVQVGFNQDLAWTHTVSTGQRFTLHELKLVPDDPARYLVGGLAERMRARTVRYEVLKADGTLESRLHTVWMTRYGPVIALPRAGLSWTAQTAYALQDANTWNVRATDTWLAINRATRVSELQAALRQQGTAWANTVAADRHGDVLYADASAVPDLDAAQLQRCAASKAAAALATAAGLVLLDGSRADCQWRKDPAATVPGLIPLERMPTLERRDWVQNANDSYWLSNPLLALDGVSPMVGPVGVPQGLRTRGGITQIMARLAGTDGLADHGKVGLAEVQAMLLMNRNEAAALVLDDLLAACAAPSEGLAAARPAVPPRPAAAPSPA